LLLVTRVRLVIQVIHVSKHFKRKVDQDTIDKSIQEQFDVIERFLLEEKDPRTLAAERFYDEVPSGIVKVHKTTRAGATVALCSESVRRKELCVMVCRTNRNITKTLKEEMVSVVGHPVNVIHIMRNSFCPRIMDLIAKHPAIELLGVIPLPNCDHCSISPCPIREAFETPAEDVHVYALTYAKLASLMMSRSKGVKELLDKLVQSRNIIFDEVQFLEEGDSVAVSIWEKKGSYERMLDLRKYDKLAESSPLMQRFLDKAGEVLTSLQPEIEKLKLKAAEDRHLKHLACSVETPALVRRKEHAEKIQKRREELQRLHPDKSWIEIIVMMKDEYLESMGEIDNLLFQDIVAIQELLIKAIMEPKKYDLTEEDIIALSRLLFLVNADVLVVSYVRGLEGEQISIQSENSVLYSALRSFLFKLLHSGVSERRRIIFTTATFGVLKIESLLNLYDVVNYVWGDPLNTSSKFLVVADRFRVSPYNFGKKLENIIALIKAIVERFGPKNVQVCTMNKAWSKRIGFESTWYASDLTEGVSSKKRIWIMVGLAEKPVNAKDHLAITQAPYHDNPLDLQGEEFLYYVSQKLRADSVHISSYQAFSRAKDPESKSRSIVIVIGARKEDVEKCLLWGPTRTLKPVKTEKGGLKFDVEIENPVGKPHITVAPLTTDIEESLHIIAQWISYGKITEYKLNWAHLKKMVDARGYVSAKRLIKAYGLNEDEVKKLLSELPDFFASQGIADYVLVRDSAGAVKAVAQKEYYEKQGKPSIILSTRFSLVPIVHSTWFISLKGAVDRAPEDFKILPPGYFNHHVSSNIYTQLSEFLDVLAANPNLCPGWIVVGEKGGRYENRKLIRDIYCLGAWSPSFPRRFGVPQQSNVNDITSLFKAVIASIKKRLGAYISVYSFPEGVHPSEGGNPPIDTIFIDIDLESPAFSDLMTRFEKGDNVVSELLALRHELLGGVIDYAKSLVSVLTKQGIVPRVILSGFKGLHIFIDLVPVQFGSLEMAKQVLTYFTRKLAQDANIRIDTSVCGDLSRLCRIPNTVNVKASKVLGRPQYAVPVAFDKLKTLTPEAYDQLCFTQEFVAVSRVESMDVSRELIKIARDLDPDDISLNIGKGHVRDPTKVAEYEAECTREILTDEEFADLPIRPCFKHVREHCVPLDGSQGHMMRIAAAMELALADLSISSIVRWFNFLHDFDPDFTRRKVEELISYGYMDKSVDDYGNLARRGFKCSTIQTKCANYCLMEQCPIFMRRKK